MTLFQLLSEGTQILDQAEITNGEKDAKFLLLSAFNLDMAHYLMRRMEKLEDDGVNKEENQRAVTRYWDMLEKRRQRIPLQQILNSQEFMGLEFYVNEQVLIPRQDTETLVELVLEEQKSKEKKVLDLCTGSGCIAVSLAMKGGYKSVTATDISLEALKVAGRNDKTGKIRFLQGDLFEALGGEERFDVITANPPYIPTEVIHTLEPEVRDHEPVLALDGAGDGLAFYRRIAKDAGNYLNPGGSIYLEIGYDQGEAVGDLMREAGLTGVRVVKDLPGNDRVVCAVWQIEGGSYV